MISRKIIVPKQIAVMTVFSVLLNIVYLFWSDSIFSLYIIWNIILALVPFYISFYLLKYFKNEGKSKAIYVLGMLFWILFFPNAPYLITDLIHVGESVGVPLWFDSLALFCSAWVGIMLAIYSLSFIEEILLAKFSKKFSNFLIVVAIILSSFGIYLGRFLRLNSWDALLSPKYVFNQIYLSLSNPMNHSGFITFTVIFFIFIFVSFYAWKFTQHKEL